MPRRTYKSTNKKIEFVGRIINYDEKYMKSHLTVPFRWAQKNLNKKLKVKIEVIEDEEIKK